MTRVILILVLITAFSAAGCKASNDNLVCFKNSCFHVQIAESENERSHGLMFKDSLPANQGMLFIFEQEEFHPFWMKNMSIPLDIIWLNNNKEAVFINANTPPCKDEPCQVINPDTEAKYVLEINAGLAERIGLKLGDKLNF